MGNSEQDGTRLGEDRHMAEAIYYTLMVDFLNLFMGCEHQWEDQESYLSLSFRK